VLEQRLVDRRPVHALGLVALVACGSKQPIEEASRPSDAAVAQVADAAVVAPPPPQPERLEHAVYGLVDNRHAVHRYVAGDLVIDASDVGLARYTRFSMPAPRWHLGHLVEGVRAAEVDRLASLEIPLDAELATGITRLVARVHGHDKLVLSLKLNGRKAGPGATLALAEGWQTIALPIEHGVLGIGENQLVLETTGKAKGTIAIEWLRFASREVAHDDPRPAAGFDAKANVIRLAKDATLLWYVTIPDGAHLVAKLEGPCKVEVQARAGDDSFAGGMLAADSARVDLTKMAGRVVGLTLTARDCPVAKIGSPEIMLHGAAPAPLGNAERPRYIVLWVMDALRADKVASFTPGARALTPNLDELAKSSTVFRQYYVQGNESQTSHSSMWTGLYPAVHNVRMAGAGGSARIDAGLDVVASRLAAAGMYTAAVTGNGFVSEEGGYTRGFNEYRNMMREAGVPNGVIYGQKIVDAALARFDAHRDQPLYLFLGTIDTHSPWIARHPWIETYSPRYSGPFKDFATAKDLGFKPSSMGCSVIPPPADIERLRAIYDSAISYHDQQVGRVVAQLKSWGIWDQTMLVITADHGEELFEDRRCGHGGSLRDSLVRVPLLVHDPARFPGGTVIEEGAEGVDLMPTLLEAVGAPGVAASQGESLVALAQGAGRGWPRPSYASMYEYAHAMRIGRWKVRVGKLGTPIVGDLSADPAETTDLARVRPVERRMLTDNLGLFLALRMQWKKHAWGVTTNVTHAGAAALDEVQTP